jgi:hypothetical protein
VIALVSVATFLETIHPRCGGVAGGDRSPGTAEEGRFHGRRPRGQIRGLCPKYSARFPTGAQSPGVF